MSSESSWPPVRYETLPWTSKYPAELISRRQALRHLRPYQAAIVPEIAAQELTLPGEVLAAAEDAGQEIARFDTEMGGEIAPFGSVLLRSESAASSQIEHLTASARAIAEAELGETSRPNAAEVVANTRAMDAAVAMADRLNAAAILAMHRALMESHAPDIAGRWREEQVWIGGSNIGPHDGAFVPPHHSRVLPAIEDLMSYARRDDVPILAQTAVVHAQFETIHPFSDGNGRTGRALLHSMLRNKGLTRNVTVPVSAGLLTDTTAYFDALDTYRKGDPSAIVVQLSNASHAAIANGRYLVVELRGIRAAWNGRIAARRDSVVWRVADMLVRHPVINAQLLASELGIAVSNVYRYIEPLERAGVLIEFTNRRRNRLWRAPEVLAALDAFAARAGRRSVPRAPAR